jgi:hypothetical protein
MCIYRINVHMCKKKGEIVEHLVLQARHFIKGHLVTALAPMAKAMTTNPR